MEALLKESLSRGAKITIKNINFKMSEMKINNLFSNIPKKTKHEILEILMEKPNISLERIISQGQATPPGKWLEQKTNEWVILLTGAAKLLFEGETKSRLLQPGDYVYIPTLKRHRVEWTSPKHKTIWLALHFV